MLYILLISLAIGQAQDTTGGTGCECGRSCLDKVTGVEGLCQLDGTCQRSSQAPSCVYVPPTVCDCPPGSSCVESATGEVTCETFSQTFSTCKDCVTNDGKWVDSNCVAECSTGCIQTVERCEAVAAEEEARAKCLNADSCESCLEADDLCAWGTSCFMAAYYTGPTDELVVAGDTCADPICPTVVCEPDCEEAVQIPGPCCNTCPDDTLAPCNVDGQICIGPTARCDAATGACSYDCETKEVWTAEKAEWCCVAGFESGCPKVETCETVRCPLGKECVVTTTTTTTPAGDLALTTVECQAIDDCRRCVDVLGAWQNGRCNSQCTLSGGDCFLDHQGCDAYDAQEDAKERCLVAETCDACNTADELCGWNGEACFVISDSLSFIDPVPCDCVKYSPNPCTECSCQDGKLTDCVEMSCPPIECEGNAASFVPEGECCATCPTGCQERKFCPEVYDPVCGSDGNTYPNLCAFENYVNCEKETDEVLEWTKGECDKVCDRASCPLCQYGSRPAADDECCDACWDPCTACPGGTFNNGCQDCRCGSDGLKSVACTTVQCIQSTEPMCTEEVSCETCDSGRFFDGCNECTCEGGVPSCTEMFCTEDKPAVCLEAPSLCEIGFPLLDSAGMVANCGRSVNSQECEEGSYCNISPIDAYAVCCSCPKYACPERTDCQWDLSAAETDENGCTIGCGVCVGEATDAPTPVPVCTDDCDTLSDDRPVCGTDGITYGNACVFDCKRPDGVEVESEGACEDTSGCICTQEFAPVCGSDGDTYGNLCVFKCNNADGSLTFTEGACDDTTPNVCICTTEYEPVCHDGTTYANKCKFDCEDIDGEATAGACDTTDCVCTMDYNPVCGSDGKTYGNRCAFNCVAPEDVKADGAEAGECETTTECLCTKEYNPVCHDGTTYGNECMFNCENIDAVPTRGACSDAPDCSDGELNRREALCIALDACCTRDDACTFQGLSDALDVAQDICLAYGTSDKCQVNIDYILSCTNQRILDKYSALATKIPSCTDLISGSARTFSALSALLAIPAFLFLF